MKNEMREAVVRLNEQLQVADDQTWVDYNDTNPIHPIVLEVMEDILTTICDQQVCSRYDISVLSVYYTMIIIAGWRIQCSVGRPLHKHYQSKAIEGIGCLTKRSHLIYLPFLGLTGYHVRIGLSQLSPLDQVLYLKPSSVRGFTHIKYRNFN